MNNVKSALTHAMLADIKTH